jgi:hypothetical protein
MTPVEEPVKRSTALVLHPTDPCKRQSPALKAPPLLTGFYRSTSVHQADHIDQGIQPPAGDLPFPSFSAANASEPMLTSERQK